MDLEPKIVFGKLKGFPALESTSKINTAEFLEACREIVKLIENFGKIFTPVVHDINGNIEKLTKVYKQNVDQNKYLEDMVTIDIDSGKKSTVDSLLWLKRALEMLEQFFVNILNDKTYQEHLKHHFKLAYSKTLRPYHGWVVQETSSLIFRFIPKRSQLIGKYTGENDQNMKDLERFLQPLQMHLQKINLFYTEKNLHSNVIISK